MTPSLSNLHPVANSLFLPSEAIVHICTLMKDPHDFDAFALTSKKIGQIAHSIPIYAFQALELRGHALTRHEKFKEATMNLIEAVNDRCLTPDEIQITQNLNNNMSYLDQLKLKMQDVFSDKITIEICKRAENEYHTIFKLCCFNPNRRIDNLEIFHLSISAKTLFFKAIQSKGSIGNQFILKLKTSQKNLNFLLFNDIVINFVKQPSVSINRDSYLENCKDLRLIFPTMLKVDIEYSLRCALRDKHFIEFKNLANSCLNSTTTCQIYQDYKHKIIEACTAKREAMVKERAELRGPSGFNGTIHLAWEKINACQSNLDAATKVCNDAPNDLNQYKMLQARTELVKAFANFRRLEKRLKDINEYYEGNFWLTYPSFVEACAKDLTLLSGEFYSELCKEITANNCTERNLALQKIFDKVKNFIEDNLKDKT